MNTKKYEFEAEIKKVSDMDAAYIEFPYDIREEFGKGRVKVHVLFEDVSYDGSIVNMGFAKHIIGVRKEIRKKLGKQAGDIIHVVLWERI